MPKSKIPKEIADWIKREAPKLPQHDDQTLTNATISGADAKLSGFKVTSDTGAAIRKDHVYQIKKPVLVPVNHERRMREAYKNGGTPALERYLLPYLKSSYPENFESALPPREKSFMQKIREKFFK